MTIQPRLTKPSRLRQLPRNVWVLTLGSFLTDVSTDMIVNLIPFFLANVLGVRTVTIGLIEGVAEATASLLKAVSGRLSDRLGRRKWLTVAGYGISTAAKPFLALAASWPVILTVRFVERVGKGVRTAPRDALLADSVAPQDRGLAFGLNRAGDTAGAALGLLIALLVVWLVQGSALALAAETFRTLVWLSVLPAALTVVALAVGLREVSTAAAASATGSRSLPLSRDFRFFLGTICLFTLGNSADAFLVLRAQERGLGVVGVLGLLIWLNVVYASVSGPIGALSDRLGRRGLLLAGWLLYALVYLGMAWLTAAWQLIFLFGLYGVYYGMTKGVEKAIVADLVEPGARGAAFGLYHAAVGLVALPASLLAGLLWQGVGSWGGFGPAAPFAFGAALALLAALALAIWHPQKKTTEI